GRVHLEFPSVANGLLTPQCRRGVDEQEDRQDAQDRHGVTVGQVVAWRRATMSSMKTRSASAHGAEMGSSPCCAFFTSFFDLLRVLPAFLRSRLAAFPDNASAFAIMPCTLSRRWLSFTVSTSASHAAGCESRSKTQSVAATPVMVSQAGG